MSQREQSRVAGAFYFVVAIALIVGFGYGVIETFRSSPQVAGPLVTAFGAVLAVLAGRWWEQRQVIEQARRLRVADAYTSMIKAMFDSMGDNTLSEEDGVRIMREFSQSVLLWGPPEVIAEFNAWRKAGLADDANPVAGLPRLEALIRAMRNDLGSKNEGVGPGDLLRTFVNDVDEHPELFEQRPT